MDLQRDLLCLRIRFITIEPPDNRYDNQNDVKVSVIYPVNTTAGIHLVVQL